MRKICRMLAAIIMSLVMIFTSAISAYAAGYEDVSGVPKSFWAVYTPYENAINANDSAGIVSHGRKVIEYWLNGETAEARAGQWANNIAQHGFEINMLWSVSNNMAEHYEKLGDSDGVLWAYKAALAFVDAYKNLIPSIGGNQADMEFARTRIQTKIAGLDVEISVYAELTDGSGEAKYFGALHEPKNGIYFGETNMVMDLSKKPSAAIIYVEFETENMQTRVNYELSANEKAHGYNRSEYSVIEIAWNFKNEGRGLSGIPQQGQKVTEAAKYLKSLNTPVLLRVGAEMNIWESKANPAEYIAVFRSIADIMRREAPNVALVWSPNFVSSQGLNYDMFYPGDSYVDWVGVSLYTSRYFMGNPNTTDTNAAIYGTGRYANPVSYMKEIVDRYGNRKPIMVSEGAVSLYNTSNSENLTDWALPLIRQQYAYIPMLFPEVKAMFWFNTNLPSLKQRYDFSISPAAKSLYGQLTASGRFIGRGGAQSQLTYKELGTAAMPANAVTILTYAPYSSMDKIMVQYRLGDKWLGQSEEIPYRSKFDLSGEADGTHSLSVLVHNGGNLVETRKFSLIKNGATVTVTDNPKGLPAVAQQSVQAVAQPPVQPLNEIGVLINGKAQSFDVPPQTINGRTMLPLRAIGEAMGMTVDYDSATRMATMAKDGIVAVHVIGTYGITVNGVTTEFDTESTVT